jgi:hypothetical protein
MYKDNAGINTHSLCMNTNSRCIYSWRCHVHTINRFMYKHRGCINQYNVYLNKEKSCIYAANNYLYGYSANL